MSELVAKTLFCASCEAWYHHVPSDEYPQLHKCTVCRTLTNEKYHTHTHTHGVTPSPNIHGYKWHDRVVRQKPEEKREGERE